jgi:TolB-like protein
MKKLILKTAGFALFCGFLLPCRTSFAERTKVIVVLDMESVEGSFSQEELLQLTDSVYAAATEVSPEFFSVISREKLSSVLSAQKNESGKTPESHSEVGALLGADMVFSGEVRRTGTVRLEVTVKLMETGSGRILGLERADAQDLGQLWTETRKAARQLLMPLVTSDVARQRQDKPGAKEQAGPGAPEQPSDFLIQIRSTPADAEVRLDGKVICRETPCSYRVEPGEHTFTVGAEHYKDKRKHVEIGSALELVFDLEPKKYTYIGMHDADEGGWGITVGVSPLDTEYKTITVLDGYEFANLHPVFDVGFGGQIFGYRETPHGMSWSILGFGPTVRMGRLIISSQVQLLSFRPESREYGEGWLPGITTRAQIPLINHREADGWAALIPAPTAGIDVWFHKLDYDQYNFWLGLSWLGGIDF